jgi:hypothetical protein
MEVQQLVKVQTFYFRLVVEYYSSSSNRQICFLAHSILLASDKTSILDAKLIFGDFKFRMDNDG